MSRKLTLTCILPPLIFLGCAANNIPDQTFPTPDAFFPSNLTEKIINASKPNRDLVIGDTRLHFIETGTTSDYRPNLIISSPHKIKIVQFPFINNYWVYAGRSHDGRRLWAITTFGSGDAGDQLEILASADGGWTWQHTATLKKPYYMSHFDAFRMDPDGRGEIVVVFDNPSVNPTLEAGCYIYETNDWGMTWAPPRFQADVMERAMDMQGGDDDDLRYWRDTTKKALRRTNESVTTGRTGGMGKAPKRGR